MVAETQVDAMAAAKEISRRPSTKGIRVVREVYDRSTSLSHAKTLYEYLKDSEDLRVRRQAS